MGCANHRIRRSESEYFLIKAKNAKVFQKGKHADVLPLMSDSLHSAGGLPLHEETLRRIHLLQKPGLCTTLAH